MRNIFFNCVVKHPIFETTTKLIHLHGIRPIFYHLAISNFVFGVFFVFVKQTQISVWTMFRGSRCTS